MSFEMFKKQEKKNNNCGNQNHNQQINKNQKQKNNKDFSKNDIENLQTHLNEFKKLLENRAKKKPINLQKLETTEGKKLTNLSNSFKNAVNNNKSLKTLGKILLSFFDNLQYLLYSDGDKLKINAIKDILKSLKSKNIVNRLKILNSSVINNKKNNNLSKKINKIKLEQNKLHHNVKNVLTKIDDLYYENNSKENENNSKENNNNINSNIINNKNKLKNNEKNKIENSKIMDNSNKVINLNLINETNKIENKNENKYVSIKHKIETNKNLLSEKQNKFEKKLLELSD